MEIYIDKNFIKKEMEKVFNKPEWQDYFDAWFSIYKQEEFLNELVDSILEPGDSKEGE